MNQGWLTFLLEDHIPMAVIAVGHIEWWAELKQRTGEAYVQKLWVGPDIHLFLFLTLLFYSSYSFSLSTSCRMVMQETIVFIISEKVKCKGQNIWYTPIPIIEGSMKLKAFLFPITGSIVWPGVYRYYSTLTWDFMQCPGEIAGILWAFCESWGIWRDIWAIVWIVWLLP